MPWFVRHTVSMKSLPPSAISMDSLTPITRLIHDGRSSPSNASHCRSRFHSRGIFPHLVTQFTCHKLLVPVLARVLADIRDAGLQSKLTSFGGCFSFRPQRAGIKLSTHASGIAIDLNPETNQQGTVGNMDSRIVGIFRQAGFEWGGTWQGRCRDPMHFQFCTAY